MWSLKLWSHLSSPDLLSGSVNQNRYRQEQSLLLRDSTGQHCPLRPLVSGLIGSRRVFLRLAAMHVHTPHGIHLLPLDHPSVQRVLGHSGQWQPRSINLSCRLELPLPQDQSAAPIMAKQLHKNCQR